MSSKVKKYIWYQVDEGEISRVEQSSVVEFGQLRKAIKEREGLQAAASTLILKAKKTTEQEYTTLNANFFRNDCGNSFDGLIRKFTITQHNPIKVTLPGMSLFLFYFLVSLQNKTQQTRSFIHLLNF
jgi:hypothetical protein